MDSREGTRRNVFVAFTDIPIERLNLLELFRRQYPSAVWSICIVPLQFGHYPVVHADVEIRQHHDRSLKVFGQIKGGDRELKALRRVRREKEDMLCVSV